MVGLNILIPISPVIVDMAKQWKAGAEELNHSSNRSFDLGEKPDFDNITSERLPTVTTRRKGWKEQFTDALQPGNYMIHTHETDTEDAHDTVESIFDGLTEFYIWDIRDHYSSVKDRRRGEPAFKHVLVRTYEAIPIHQLPDSPRITSY